MMRRVWAEITAPIDAKSLRRVIHDRTTHPAVRAVLDILLQYFLLELSNRNHLQNDMRTRVRPEPRCSVKGGPQGSGIIRHLTTFQLLRSKFLRVTPNQTFTRQYKLGSSSCRRYGGLVKQASSGALTRQTVGGWRVKHLSASSAAEGRSSTNRMRTMPREAKPRVRGSVLATIQRFETIGPVHSVNNCITVRKNKDIDMNVTFLVAGEQKNDKRQRTHGRCQGSEKPTTKNVDSKLSEELSDNNSTCELVIGDAALNTAVSHEGFRMQAPGEVTSSEGSGEEVKEKRLGNGMHISPHTLQQSPLITPLRPDSHHCIKPSPLLSNDLENKSREFIGEDDVKHRIAKCLHEPKSHDSKPCQVNLGEKAQPHESTLTCTQLHGRNLLTDSKELIKGQSVHTEPDTSFHTDTEFLHHEPTCQSKASISQKNLDDKPDDRCQSNKPQPQSLNDLIPKPQLSQLGGQRVSDQTSSSHQTFKSEGPDTETGLITPDDTTTSQLCRRHIIDPKHDACHDDITYNATSHGQHVCNIMAANEDRNKTSGRLSRVTPMGNKASQENEHTETTLIHVKENDQKTENQTEHPSQTEEAEGHCLVQPERAKYKTFHYEDLSVEKTYIPRIIRFTDTF